MNGFYGKTCENTPCSAAPCLNDGECKVQNDSFTCECKPNFTGKHCELAPCEENPCKNNGFCNIEEYSYKCDCEYGYFGKDCEITPCTSNPCLNYGECAVDSTYGVAISSCYCPSGFSGKRCEGKNLNIMNEIFCFISFSQAKWISEVSKIVSS